MKPGKKKIAIFLLLILLGSIVLPAAAPAACAAGGSMTLAELQEALPNGKYWNHSVDYETYAKNREYYNLSCTDTPCNHGGSHSCGPNYDGSCGCNSFGLSTQCMGFARFVCYELFGSMPSGDGKTENSTWKATTIENLKPGDYIRIKTTSYYYAHSVVVIGVDSEKQTITVGECNYYGQCKISWNRTISMSELKSYYEVSCLTAGGIPTNHSITFDAAGGKCDTLLGSINTGESCLLPMPQRTGYYFDGWYTAANGGSRVGTAGEWYKPSADVTLYAHWRLLGDIDGSGALDGKDVSVFFQWWNGKKELGNEAVPVGDVNGDGVSDLRDAAAMYSSWAKAKG